MYSSDDPTRHSHPAATGVQKRTDIGAVAWCFIVLGAFVAMLVVVVVTIVVGINIGEAWQSAVS